ncbi:unnamed protein product, partial [Prorocentrum cordatum]
PQGGRGGRLPRGRRALRARRRHGGPPRQAGGGARPAAERREGFHATSAGGPGEQAHRIFQNECETTFSKFRLTVMHLRKEQEALSAVQSKEVVTRFVGRICKEPLLAGRPTGLAD